MKVDKNKMYELYEAGHSVDEITEECSCSRNYALYILQKKYGKIGKIDTGKIRALWKAGWSINSIMYEMHMTEEEVRKVVIYENS